MKNNILETIGGTPLVMLVKSRTKYSLYADIIVKIEAFNPGGSAKDRVALNMVLKAEQQGLLKPGATIIEPTSGNTGVGLALVSAVRGYQLILTMPETMSMERRKLVAAYGAQVVLTPGAEGMKGAIAKSEELNKSIDGSIIMGQFDNPDNTDAHYMTTGPEIWRDANGKVDIFIAGIGTGGTISGTGKYLKEQNPDIKIIGVEPAGSPFLTEGRSGAHGLQGIGAGFKPSILNLDIVDKIVTVTESDAYSAARQLAATEGILAGITSGAVMHVAMQLAKQHENEGKNIVVLLPDTGERYLSTELWS
ncbi:MAG: cysteine synthase A [Bacteroidaceae bacterium]|nr:cysteine synthase A [Bacteroidaceae bacterium]